MLKFLNKIFITSGQYARKHHRLVSVSEQDLVDCSKRNYGCNGGWPKYAFQDVIDNNGINTESAYPYKARDGSCKYSYNNYRVRISSYKCTEQTEDAVQKAVATVGPVSAVIDASRYTFQFYSSGVYNDPYCRANLDHAVAIVGYGKLNGKDYWTVKNSWGTSWGQRGYILMSRNKNNQCAIASNVCYPIISN